MTDLRVFLAFAALVALALFYMSLGVKSAFAPFCAVATAILWFSLFGALGAPVAGGWLFYAACLLCLGAALWRHFAGGKKLPLPCFGFWFFVGASLVALVLLAVKQPMFIWWDEFGIFGTAGKLMKISNEMYTTAPIGWAANTTQKPAVMVLNYFFQFFGPGFKEWQMYASGDVLLLAGLSTVLSAFDKKEDWDIAVPAMLVLALAPFVFRHGISINYITNVYMDATGDLPLAACFTAVLAMWFGGDRRALRGMAPVCLGLAALVLTKDSGLIFALVAAMVVFADSLFVSDAGNKLKARAKGAFARLGLMTAAIGVPFVAWEQYVAVITAGGSRLSNAGGSSGAGMLAMPFLFLRDLMNSDKSVVFTTVTTKMWEYFRLRSTMFGSGLVVLGLVGVLLAAAALLAGKKSAQRRRCLVYGVTILLGFAAYYFFIMCSYLYIFAEVEAMNLASYDRYFYPFYMGAFLAVFVLFCQSAVARANRAGAVAKAAVVALSALLLLRVNMWVPVNYTLLGVKNEDYNERREFNENAAWLKTQLPKDGKVFLVLAEDMGMRFFMYVHELLPYAADPSYGGGDALREKVRGEDGVPVVHEITQEELERHLAENGTTNLYIDSMNEHFKEMYGGLFTDGLAAYENGETRLYEVQVQSGGHVRLAPAETTEAPWG